MVQRKIDQELVESVNNRCGLSQRKMGRKFRVHHTTISRNLRKRTINNKKLERKVYENNWKAQDIDHLVQRIKRKAKELDQQILQGMMEGVRKKLRAL